MAARKATQTQKRTKEGVLEFKKSEGLKKTWKQFTFKVSASTYLLCFKTTDLARPDEQILLAHVTHVLPSASKGASFPFEVIFKGKGSPWKLNASSNEERISWMEAIKPGSSNSLTQFKKIMESSSPAVATYSDNPPPYSAGRISPAPIKTVSPSPRGNVSPAPGKKETLTEFHFPADPNPYSPAPKSSYRRQDNFDDNDDFLSASLPPLPDTPQEYLLPSTPTSKGSPGGPHLPPHRGMSEGHMTHPRPSPRPRRRTAPPVKYPPTSNGHGATPDDPDYVKMKSSPVKKPSADDKLPDYLEVVPDSNLDDENYVLPDPPYVSQKSPVSKQNSGGFEPSASDSIKSVGNTSQQGAGVGDQTDGATNLVDTISQHFNREQIGMLIRMLQEVRVDDKQSDEEIAKAWEVGPPPASPPIKEQDSLRGNLVRALSYAPPLTEDILVTEEDSDDFYRVRPQWAKAVPSEPHPFPCDQPDTLTDLQNEALYLAKTDLSDLHVIGQGQFGKVYKGLLKRGSESMPVAIKMTKKTISEYLQQSFLKEMNIMMEMMHPNIVRMYGLVTEDVSSPWIVLEYMENGDLKSFLTKNQRPIQQLVKYMVDVAMGMHYISERGLVHRDLAARNVLVDTNETCKVADFGLLREIPRDDTIYHSQHNVPCPIRWMAPESISDRKFSAASDVWSFGVLVWEMFNPTKLPYEKYDNLACATKVNEGLRMPIPRGTPSVVAKIMKACWHKNPNKRPSFLLISTLLSTRTTF